MSLGTDPLSGAASIMSMEHRHIHDGKGFQGSFYLPSLASDASIEVLLVAPSVGSRRSHLRKYTVTGATGGPLLVRLFEGTTVSDNGTTIPIYNLNRGHTRVPGLAAYSAPTITDDGTEIETLLVTGQGSAGPGAGNVKGPDIGEEWMLQFDMNYMFRITNQDNSAVALTAYAFFYEL